MYDSMELRVTCSVGVVVYPDKNNSVHELLRYADTAMYRAKELGRDNYQYVTSARQDGRLLFERSLHPGVTRPSVSTQSSFSV